MMYISLETRALIGGDIGSEGREIAKLRLAEQSIFSKISITFLGAIIEA